MADKTYSYHGPLSAVTLAADAAHPNGRHVQLFPGSHVTLSDDNDYIKSLVARGYLKPVAETATEASSTESTASAKTTATTASTDTNSTKSADASAASSSTNTTASTTTATGSASTTGTTSTTGS